MMTWLRFNLGRLRYWLHPSQAPKYGKDFIASEVVHRELPVT